MELAQEPTQETTDSRPVLRAGGWSAIGAALFYILQPVAVLFLIPGATETGQYSTPDQVARWTGPYEVVAFGGVAVCTLLLVVAVGRLLPRDSTLPWFGAGLGLVGAAGWLATAGLSLSSVSLIGRSLADIDVSSDVQREAVQTVAVIVGGSVGIAAFGAAGWAITVGLVVLRTHALSRSLGWIALVGGLLIMIVALGLVHPIPGALVLIPLYLALGATMLHSARHT